MSGRADAVGNRSGSARAALRSALHLACVDGPDAGAVLPVPGPIGRDGPAGLSDPRISRAHALVEAGPRGASVRDLGSLNGSVVLRRGTRHRVRGDRGTRVRSGDRILVGDDVLVLRRRPTVVSRPHRGRPRWRMWLLPLVSLFVLMGARIAVLGASGRGSPLLIVLVGAVVVAGCAAAFIGCLRRAHRLDPTRLALVLANLAASASAVSESVAPLDGRDGAGSPRIAVASSLGGSGRRFRGDEPIGVLVPFGGRFGRRLDLGTASGPRAIGCLGPGRLAAARWIASALVEELGGATVLDGAARFRFGSGGGEIHLVEAGPCPHCGERPPSAPIWHVAAAPSIEGLPEWCDALVDAGEVALAPDWWERFDARDPGSELPADLALGPLLRGFADRSSPLEGLAVPVGVDGSGAAVLDLVADGPHALLVGSTGSGKSEALLTWLRAMCALYGPEEVRLVLVDYKGGAAFAALERLPHVEAVFTDLAADATSRALRGIATLLRGREAELADLGLPDYSAWVRAHREGGAPAPPPRIVVAIDEFAVLAQAHGSGIEALARLAAQGRSLGLHLIAATQRPAGAVTAGMRANLDLRIALRCVAAADSVDVVGDARAAELPRVPGRAVIAGRGVLQFARSSSEDRPATPASTSPRDASGEGAARLPWAPRLPTSLAWVELDAADGPGRDSDAQVMQEQTVALALLDGIDTGAHAPLLWHSGAIGVVAPAVDDELVHRAVAGIALRIGTMLGRPVHLVGADAAPRTDPSTRAVPGRTALTPTTREYLEGAPTPPSASEGSMIDCADGEDIAVLLSEAAEHAPCVLAFADAPAARRALARTYGPLAAEEIWEAGLHGCEAAGVDLVLGAPAAREGDALLAKCALRFERPDPHDPAAPRDSAGIPREPAHWRIRSTREAPRLAVLPDGKMEPPNSTGGHASLRGPLVVPWADRARADESPCADEGPTGATRLGTAPTDPTSSGIPPVLLLVGPLWEALEECLSRSARPAKEAQWVLYGAEADGDPLHRALGSALVNADRAESATAAPIDRIASASWTCIASQTRENLVLVAPPPELLRLLERGPNPPPPALLGRIRDERRGLARIDGRWTRLGVAVSQS